MSGWIRVKELPARYEVRSLYADDILPSRAEAERKLEEARLLTPGLPFRLVTVRRWQVKRREVTEERFDNCVNYRESIVAIVTVSPRFNGQWSMKPLHSGTSFYLTREEAEAAARAWLNANDYRIRKVTT